MQIALDLEGVLADTHLATRDRSDRLGPEHFEYWGFDDEMWDHYHHVSQNLWHNHWEDIDPMEPALCDVVRILRYDHTVDILTARTGVDDQIQKWLDANDIQYDGFTATKQPKHEFDYGVFIDDNPRMAGDVDFLYMRDRPWNRDAPAEDSDVVYYTAGTDVPVFPSENDGRSTVVRVHKLIDVVYDLAGRDWG